MSFQFETEYSTSTFKGDYDDSTTDIDTGMVIFDLYGKITIKLAEEKMYPLKISDPHIVVKERIQKGNEIFEKGIIYRAYIAIPMADYPMFSGNMKTLNGFLESNSQLLQTSAKVK